MSSPDALPPDTRQLITRLSEMGATEDEIDEATRTGTLGPLALELALRGPDVISFEDAARQAGVKLEDAARLWRAVGFPDPLAAPPRITPKQVMTIRVLAGARAVLGDQAALQLAPLIGGSMSRLAEAIVDAFRINVEMPRRDRGEPTSQVVEDYSRMAAAVLPPLTEAIGDLLIGHVLTVARANWALDEQRAAVTRDLVIGFADLVGYTQAAQALSPAGLTGAISRFEARSSETITRHGGRVVKLIGDEVMFVIEDHHQATELALDLLREVADDPELTQVRIGLAAGPVVSHHGDYYGNVVNLAARLVKAAEPGTAMVSAALGSSKRGETIELPALKGYDHPVEAWRLVLR
jgi:class 3 adenylate cyclase